MNGSNKILTVSYGTFSCTLEGFDDPFNSMRSIAEYFRDLAADDRYFGAEPPTPDMEMLQALAQRETRGRIEARASENGVSLRVAEKSKVEDTGPLAADDDFMTADEPEDALVLDETAEAHDAPVSEETIAEKLKRIRAVVSRSTEPVSHVAPMEFDAPVEPRSRALTRTLSDIAADIAGDDEDGSGFEADVESEDDDTPQAFVDEDKAEPSDEDMADLRALDAPAAEATSEPEVVDDSHVEDEDEDDFETGFEMSTPSSLTEDFAEDEGDEHAESNAFEAMDETEATDEGNAFTEEESEADEVQASEEDDDDEEDEEEPSASEADEDDGLGVSRVMAVLSGKTDETAPVQSEFEDEDVQNAALAEEAPRRESRSLGPIETDGDDHVGRLMDETEGKLAEDDGVRRRRVISQMRAAVAATRADRILSRVSQRRDDGRAESPYRRDLDRVVTANRESAPLMLVSELRVDESERPQRVEQHAPAPAEKDDEFSRFASEMGANGLPELLEAAAAYTAFVEGQPHFSRPDIMKRVAGFDPEMRMSREQGLRSFGQLLREGKIRKLQRGQFTVDESTRFNPAHRIAGE